MACLRRKRHMANPHYPISQEVGTKFNFYFTIPLEAYLEEYRPILDAPNAEKNSS